jgi:asparagine synthase (glutamine-hydrolysing)
MTGICGWLGQDGRQSDRQTLDAMAAGLSCAGNQVTQHYVTPNAAAHVRSWQGNVHWHRDEELIAAIDGVPYWSHDELAETATSQGHASAAALGYRRFGDDLLDHLHGAFSIAVLCPARRRALVAIDRFGIHAMCFAQTPNDALVFGTTVDSVRAHPAIDTALTPQAVFNFLVFYVSPAPDTVYAGIRKLTAGQRLVFEGGKPRLDTYWRMPYRTPAKVDRHELAEEVRRLIATSVARCLGDGPSDKVGSFLSGGLDSSSVCGFFAEAIDRPAKCFTIAFKETAYDESAYARLAAQHFGLDHRLHTLSPDDAADFLPTLATAYDEPFGNSSAIPVYYCAREAARSGIESMLAGDGGDEYFAGNERYVGQAVYERYQQIPALLRHLLLTPVGKRLPADTRGSLIRRAGNYIRRASVPLPERLYIENPLIGQNAQSAFSPDVLAQIDTAAPFAVLHAGYDAAPGEDRVRRMMRLDMQLTLADNDLRKVVRMCELAGLQVRFPLLDEALVEFAAGIPTATLLEGGVLRAFYKYAMRDFLPERILNKPKHGFGMPFDLWLHESPRLRDMAIDNLKAFGQRGYLRSEVMADLVDCFESGRPHPLSGLLWDVFTLELWLSQRDADVRRPASKSA